MDTPEVMDIRQASAYLGVSRNALYKYVGEDRIPAFKLGNRWKFKKTVLDHWMENESRRAISGHDHPVSASHRRRLAD